MEHQKKIKSTEKQAPVATEKIMTPETKSSKKEKSKSTDKPKVFAVPNPKSKQSVSLLIIIKKLKTA